MSDHEPTPNFDARYHAGFVAGSELERKRIIAWLRNEADATRFAIIRDIADKLEKEPRP